MRWKSPFIQLSLIICLAGFFANEVFAQDAEPAARETAVEKQTDQETEDAKYAKMSLDELAKDFSSKMKAYMRRYQLAPKAEKRQVVQTMPKVKMYQTRLYEMVNEEPGSEAGLEVIDWWYRRGKSNSGDIITRLILKNYAKLETIEKYVPRVVWHLPQDEAEEQLRMLLKVNSFDSVKGSASYRLQNLLTEKAKKLEGEDAQVLLVEAKALRDVIYEKYPAVVDSDGVAYSSLLDAAKFAKKLEIGKPVPDIVGSDLEGVEFKLSDYDGKVRVISYWGDW